MLIDARNGVPGTTPSGRLPKLTVKVLSSASYSPSSAVCTTAAPLVLPAPMVMPATSVKSPAPAVPSV